MPTKKSYIIIIIGSHSAGNASHRPQHHSPTRRLAGRRHEHRPAFRPREPLRAGAARRAQLHHADHPFQESLAGTLQFACHFLTTPHTHILSAMPKHAPPHPSLTHAHAACTHSHAGRIHHAGPPHVRALRPVACFATAACNVPPQGVTPALAVTPSSEETASRCDITLPIVGLIILAISLHEYRIKIVYRNI